MADNIEKIPGIATDVPHYNTQVNSVVRGHNSIVEKSAINVIENGSFNYVGNGCRNINILNSSGCVVFDNRVGVTLINSSGIQVYEDNVVYINNNKINRGLDVSNPPTLVSSDYTATINDRFILITTSGVTVTIPQWADIGDKEWIVKNISNGDSYCYTVASSGFDIESPVVNTITLTTNDSVNLKAYYSYILIL